MSMSKKRSLTLEETAFEGPAPKLENVWIEVDREAEGSLSETEINYAIEAFSKSESNTLGYLAACFSPILLLLTSVEYFDSLNDVVSNVLITSVVLFLGYAGIYFASYRTLLLTSRRIFFEGYQLKLINGFSFPVFPSGKWKIVNVSALFSMLIGYASLILLLLWRVWA